jgi:hypothetical protein
MVKAKRILVISDLHAPYGHPDTLKYLTWLKAIVKPDYVVQSGDEIDGHSISYHEKNPELPSAGMERREAIRALKPIYKLFPKTTVLDSNHGSLYLRKALTAGLPESVIKSYNEILEAPKGWKWVRDLTLMTPLGPVYFCHGKAGAPGKLSSQYGMSTVQGHYHEKCQINYTSTPERLIFDMHVGCLADDTSRALDYNKINAKRPIIASAAIINGVPQIIPMVLNSSGRWVGK